MRTKDESGQGARGAGRRTHRLRAINVCVLSLLSSCVSRLPFQPPGPLARQPGPGRAGGHHRASGPQPRGPRAPGGVMRARAEFRPWPAGGHCAGRDGTDPCSPFYPRSAPGLFARGGQEGVNGAPPPPELPSRGLIREPSPLFSTFPQSRALNRAAQTSWRQKRRSCHD